MISTIIQPKLGLRSYTDSGLSTYAGNIVNQLTLHATSFPGMKPTLPQLQALIDKYENSLDRTKHGTPSDTAAKNEARLALENCLTAVARSCADIANGDIVLFLLSGFQIKASPRPSGLLDAPRNFTIELGPFEGTMYAKFNGVKNANAYEVHYGTANTEPSTWTKYKVTTAGKVMITDFPGGVVYSFRVRAIGAKGKQGEWTEIVTKKTY